jgi:hypothetical protein
VCPLRWARGSAEPAPGRESRPGAGSLYPPTVGAATFTLRLWENGVPVSGDTGAVLIHLAPASQPGLRAVLNPVAHGSRFSAWGSLAMDGTWRIDVLVRTARVNTYRTLPYDNRARRDRPAPASRGGSPGPAHHPRRARRAQHGDDRDAACPRRACADRLAGHADGCSALHGSHARGRMVVRGWDAA